MIRLPSTTYTLQLILSAGTADVDVSYSDQTTTAYTGGTQETAATATTQTICAAPAASTVRDIDFLSVKIKTVGGVVTVQKLNSSGAVVTQLISVTLLDEEELNYTHGSGWTALDANGNRKEISSNIFGALTASSITDTGLTSGRVTYAGTGGLLQDSANLTFNGTTLTANTIGAYILSGNITQTGNPSINIGSGALTAGATSVTTLTASSTVNSTAVKSYVFSLAAGATKTVTVTVPAGSGQFMVLVGGNQAGAEGYAYASWMLGGDFADAGTPAYAFSNIVAPVSNFRLSFSTITIGSGSFTFQAISSAGSNTANITVTIIGALHTGAVPTIAAS